MKKSGSRDARVSGSAVVARPSAFLSWQLGGLGLAALTLYALIADLSKQFVPGEGHEQRPILTVLGLLAVAHALYLLALWAIANRDKNRAANAARQAGALWIVLGFAVAFRVIQLPANPIQEIDIYRYLWDGQVTRAGVNPYAYSPAQVDHGLVQVADAERLRERLTRQHPVLEIFHQVDHRNVPTVYPPASQATFLLAAVLTPAGASVQAHVGVMKALFVAFDVGTILLLIQLLKAVGKSPLWCLAYAWCPLAIKEIANSAHLDAQAIFFTTLALWLLIRGQRYFGALAWAAAILSKWYPLILLPLIVRQLWSVGRWPGVIGPTLLALCLVAAAQFAVWPAATPTEASPAERLRAPHETPLKGLRAFLTEWEMNALAFHWLRRGIDTAWPAESQRAFVDWASDWAAWPWQMAQTDVREQRVVSPSFVLAYLLVGLAVGVFALWWTWRRWRESDALITGAFYVLVLFFLLNPTCNPWYLLWAVPFLPWAKECVWYLLPAVVLQYYLRFWFAYQYGDRPGMDHFDKVWLWVEWGPFYFLLLAEIAWRRFRKPAAHLPPSKPGGS